MALHFRLSLVGAHFHHIVSNSSLVSMLYLRHATYILCFLKCTYNYMFVSLNKLFNLKNKTYLLLTETRLGYPTSTSSETPRCRQYKTW